MPRIISISFPDDQLDLIDKVDGLGGSRSAHIVAALDKYLETVGPKGEAAPQWYIPGNDYSHLPEAAQERLVQFGYVIKESNGD